MVLVVVEELVVEELVVVVEDEEVEVDEIDEGVEVVDGVVDEVVMVRIVVAVKAGGSSRDSTAPITDAVCVPEPAAVLVATAIETPSTKAIMPSVRYRRRLRIEELVEGTDRVWKPKHSGDKCRTIH